MRGTDTVRLRAARLRPRTGILQEEVNMGVDVEVNNLTKSFGKQLIWKGVTLTLPAGEVSVMLGSRPTAPRNKQLRSNNGTM